MQIHYSLRVSSKAAARHAFRPSLPRSLHLHIRACCPMSSLEIITDPFERSGVAAVNSPRRINKVLLLAFYVHEEAGGQKFCWMAFRLPYRAYLLEASSVPPSSKCQNASSIPIYATDSDKPGYAITTSPTLPPQATDRGNGIAVVRRQVI